MSPLTPSDTAPAAPCVPGFDYDAVPAADRDWLRGATDQARRFAYRTAVNLIRSGMVICDVRARLKDRTFRKWLASELPWSKSHSYRLIQVADAFGSLLAGDGPDQFEPTALYMLARPEVPASARDYAAELARERVVTAADAREILDAHRPVADLTRAELKAYAERRKAAGADARTPAPRAAGEDPGAALWAAFADLMARSTLVHISRIDEEDELFSVTVHAEASETRNAVRRELGDAILAAGGKEPVKRCPGCRKGQPIGLFGANAKMRDGLNRRCKACERPRLKAAKKAKKGKERACGAEVTRAAFSE